MDDINVTQTAQPAETVQSLKIHKDKPQKTAKDWVRDMRMSAAVNKANTGVETEQVTPDLLLATSRKLLGISKREQEPDPKDSLSFQRFYGPETLFMERILRDGGKLARNILWKATNRGNLDFMPVNALDKHISSVFYDSKLAQMMDGSSPLETIDSAYKTTRIGEGGVSSMDSAPEEMRTVQPSYFGYIDPVRCFAEDTELMTESGWKKVQDITGEDKLACLINNRLEYHKPTALSVYDYDGTMYGYDDNHIAYLVTPNHRMYTRCADPKRDGTPCKYNIRTAEDIHGTHRVVNTGMHLPILRNEDELVFHLPPVTPDLKHEQVYGMPPQGANLKNVDEIDIVDFAEYMGWYLSEGCCGTNETRRCYQAIISQSPQKNPKNYTRIKNLIERLPFNAHCASLERGCKSLAIGRKQLVVYLQQFGKSDTKFIPEWIFNAPLKARLAFREAMLLGDGRDQRHLCTMSKRLAEDFARLQFELGESVFVYHEPEKRHKDHPGIWVVYWHKRKESCLQKRIQRSKAVPYYTVQYNGKVYCPTVPGGLVYSRKSSMYSGLWIGQSPESYRVGLDVYMTKNVMKGTDGKLYQKFIDAKTGKEVLLDSETAANSVIVSPEMMEADTKSVFALGGPTGIRIVPKSSVQYYLPRADEAYSAASNLVTMLSGVKEMRLQMGCLHPDTTVLTRDKKGMITIQKAQATSDGSIPGATKEGISQVFDIRTTVAKFPPKRNWFRKIVLKSGRSLITSVDHRWPVLRKGKYMLVEAQKLRKGDIALRSSFKDVPSRKTFIKGMFINRDTARALGYIVRSLAEPDNEKMRVIIPDDPLQLKFFMRQMARFGWESGFNTYYMNGFLCIGIRDPEMKQWLRDNIGASNKDRRIPSAILSAGAAIVGAFLDGYTSDPTKVGRDSNDDIWILDIPNNQTRDGLAFLFSRVGTDTLYRDAADGKDLDLALKLQPMISDYGDMIQDEIKVVVSGISSPLMVDIDINDNLYATANGVVTHNSKYPLQAISIGSREPPLVRGLDEASGKDMPTVIGKYLGARFAPQDGVVTAVRKDRIDVKYNDGTKGSIDMYVNFPMNAKGFINNTPQVKAGQPFKKGDILASSNYTDDKGVAALGTNLRSAWMSWKGGTYEDAIVISESAAKKLSSTTMYKTAVDLDKTIKLGKANYATWKPAEFTKDQLDMLDANGIIKPGTTVHKDDPLILAVQATEPSPGTMGKRILTDVSEKWEHDYPGVVTDVVKTRKGIKVYATVTAPAEVGDKLSNSYGNKGVISQIIPDDQMPQDQKGQPFEILFSPLGLITRCYDEQTEFLTKTGWKFGRDITEQDKFYTYNRETATWEWGEQINPFWKQKYNGTMYGFKNDAVDFLVTHGHRVWSACDYPGAEFSERHIEDIYGKRYRLPCVAERRQYPVDATPFSLPPCEINKKDTHTKNDELLLNPYDWAEFLGWYLAEGNTTFCERTREYRVNIAQNDEVNPEKTARIADLLNRLPFTWNYGRKNKQFHISNKRLAAYLKQFGYCWEKYIPDWLFVQPDAVIERFLDAIMAGDGNCLDTGRVTKDGRPVRLKRIKLTSEKLIDQLQMLYCMLGVETVKKVCGNDKRYPQSHPMYNLSISTVQKYTRTTTVKGWYQIDYDGMTYCPTVKSGYILTRRNGKIICLGNTNPSQLYEALLAKIAHKKGQPITVPQFFKGSIAQFVDEQLKQNHVKADDDLVDPETGRTIADVLNGYTYTYKLKHLSESKMSARGTSTYDSEEMPGGKGMDGCFPGDQRVMIRNGKVTISSIAKNIRLQHLVSADVSQKNRFERRFYKAIDRFTKLVPASDIITITPHWSYTATGALARRCYSMSPTKNHAIYMYDMTQKHAGDLKPGDKIAGLGKRPSSDQMQIIYNLINTTGAVVKNDILIIETDNDYAPLYFFKYRMLKDAIDIGWSSANLTLMLPNYSMWAAAVTEADQGDIAICLSALDKKDSDCLPGGRCAELIAKYIPAKCIPKNKYPIQDFCEKQQKITPATKIDTESYMGIMPLVVAKIEPYQTDKDFVKVYDLTVETSHRYVLDGGFVVSNSKRFGTLEQSAMAGHNAFDIIKDSKFIRGQSNSDFWRSIRTGDIPTIPGEPLVHKKFWAHLTGAGINVKKTPQGVSIFALTNSDVKDLAGPRELKSRDTYETRNFRPIDGGLFGQDVFGINGDKWGYIQLDEPMPNPVMEEPLARLLGIPEKRFAEVADGRAEVNGIRGSKQMKEVLSKMDLQAEAYKAHQAFKTASPSGKDKALKRYVAIERMRRAGVNPADYMLDRIPVLPPVYRPVSSHNGLTMVADSNYLYAQLLDARDDAREAKNLPAEYQQQARENIYQKWKELTGLYAPQDIKLQSKHVQGLLKWALGDSPKFSALQRKVLSATVDTVGRGAVTPDPRLKLNEVGLPEEMAFGIMAPFVERALVKRGYTPLQAMKMVKEKHSQARDVLVEVMKTHPVLMNRAPTLHKLGIMAYNPRLVTGHAIRVNPSTVVPFNMDFDGDTVNIHAPVSDRAIKEAYNKMFPERNLVGMRSREILYKPEKEYQQGLYIGTRMKAGPDVRTHYFNTIEEAKEDYRQGIIDIDDPIEIKQH